jgi:hypothetical protein
LPWLYLLILNILSEILRYWDFIARLQLIVCKGFPSREKQTNYRVDIFSGSAALEIWTIVNDRERKIVDGTIEQEVVIDCERNIQYRFSHKECSVNRALKRILDM